MSKPFQATSRFLPAYRRRWPFSIIAIGVALVSAVVMLAATGPVISANQPRAINIEAKFPTRYWLAAGTNSTTPTEPANGLADIKAGSLGWFEYVFDVEVAGWYRLIADTKSDISRTEFRIDHATSDIRVVDAAQINVDQVLVGWVWLPHGSHDLRVQQFYWTGLPQISRMRLEMPLKESSRAFRVVPMFHRSFEVNKCSSLEIESGGNSDPFIVDVTFRRKSGQIRKEFVQIDASSGLSTHTVNLWCDAAGDARVELRSRGSSDDLHQQAKLIYSVFDVVPAEANFEKGRIIVEVDAATRSPDYVSGSTGVVSAVSGRYRTSDGNGSTPFSRRFGAPPAPSWFGYRVGGLIVGHAYIIECEFPDDATRMFALSVRDGNTTGYAPSIAVETGGIWPVSGKLDARRMIVWPSEKEVRLVVTNIHDGMNAAISRITVFEAIEIDRDRQPRISENRNMLIWNEEGESFRSAVGEPRDADLTFESVDRYLKLVSASGATVFSPTAVVYNYAMYPSQFNLTFSEPERDEILPFLLGARKYGLKIVPQLHPRADEIVWRSENVSDLQQRLLISSKGERRLLRPDGSIERPLLYNALDPVVRDWYLEMIAELATRYKDYSEFSGIDLRFSFWQNQGLNNLVSLDWGYDAAAVRTFYRETGLAPLIGIDLVSDTRQAVELRRNELILHNRSAWIRWRCQKIRDIYRAIAQRVRSIRPDLRVYVSFFALTADEQPTLEALREAGLDIDLLSDIDGLTIVDARHQYGAREADPAWRRRNAVEFAKTTEFDPFGRGGNGAHVVLPMQYIEFPGSTAPPDKLGLDDRAPVPFTSAASEPPGRLSLCRFAAVLARTDAFMLGDGGNGYVFGDEDKAEFVREFVSLPMRSFQKIGRTPEAIVARQSEGIFYIVNARSDSVSINLKIRNSDEVVRVATSNRMRVVQDTLVLHLRPCELMVFNATATAKIDSIDLVSTR